MNAYERLTRAIERINTIGWVQGLSRTEVDGPGCLLGSLMTDAEWESVPYKSPYAVWKEPSLDAAIRAMGFTPPQQDIVQDETVNTAAWNDAEGRTKEEVLAALEHARDRILHQEADKGAVSVEEETAVCVA